MLLLRQFLLGVDAGDWQPSFGKVRRHYSGLIGGVLVREQHPGVYKPVAAGGRGQVSHYSGHTKWPVPFGSRVPASELPPTTQL